MYKLCLDPCRDRRPYSGECGVEGSSAGSVRLSGEESAFVLLVPFFFFVTSFFTCLFAATTPAKDGSVEEVDDDMF